LALLPELVKSASRTPIDAASSRSNASPCGPRVSQKSSTESTAASTSWWSNTRPA
jgi:hypothetical protein